jgi:prolyl-tRNA editing enzyme YbaK/EbsC (Cys-tRNA(Pro) deacylase)
VTELSTIGKLAAHRALDRPDLLAEPVVRAVRTWPVAEPGADQIKVAEIDPDLADTAAFCAAYDVPLEVSANCVIVAGRRGGETKYAAAMILATTRADVNGLVRRQLDARKASFAPMDAAVAETGMEYGGITPLGLPESWPVLVDTRVAETDVVVVGSGLRRSKILLPGRAVAALPRAVVLSDLGLA